MDRPFDPRRRRPLTHSIDRERPERGVDHCHVGHEPRRPEPLHEAAGKRWPKHRTAAIDEDQLARCAEHLVAPQMVVGMRHGE
jgi:hypothetical protein